MAHLSTTNPSPNRPVSSLAGPILVHGFAAALALWCTWFITHLPWLGVPESTSLPLVLAAWLIAASWAGVGRPLRTGILIGFCSGLLSAVLGLAILGSRIAEPAPGFEALNPGALLIAIGFLTLGAAIGMIGAVLGSFVPARRAAADVMPRDHLARFALLTALALAPLLIIGGMVTSTNSGMAVPDWPNTFGSNMFLYPLGPRAAPDVYFEHSHRLFGAFVGMAMLTLMVWTLLVDRRRWVGIMTVLAFILVCVQGILGGIRVLRGSTDLAADPALERMIHGILAQLVFALIVALAVVLTPTFRRLAIHCRCGYSLLGLRGSGTVQCPECNATRPTPELVGMLANGRVLRFMTTGMLHATILQLILGAAYRHGRHTHTLWTHAAFSIIVVIFAVMAGFAAANIADRCGGIGPILRRTGRLIIAIISVQFLLGWVSFGFGGHALRPDTAWQSLLRTSHQANGALLLALATVAYVWVLRLLWLSRRNAAPEAQGDPTPAPLTA